MSLVNLLIAILATWRISALLSYEHGAGDVFVKLRERIGIIHDDNGDAIDNDGSFLAELFSCIWCLSVWISIPVGFLIWFFPVCVVFFLPLAISAGAILVERLARD